MIKDLTEISLKDADLFGGKAAALGEMALHGIPVPPGAAVSIELFRRFLAHNRIAFEPARLAAENERVREAIAIGTFPPGDERALRDLFGRLWRKGGECFAARSSALCEDGEWTSFAGIFETCPDVRSPEDLLAAVKRCWASLATDKAIDYALARRVPLERLAMGIVVQRFARGRPSGVLFTVDPVACDPEVMVVTWVDDVCSACVSGSAASRRLYFDRRREKPALGEGLTPAQVEALVGLGEACEGVFGKRRDIEWTFAGGTLYSLQCRAITGWKERRFPIAWERDEDKEYSWRKECGPITPLDRERAFAGQGAANAGALRAGMEWFYDEFTCQNGYLYSRRKEMPDASRKREEYLAYVGGLAKEGKNVFTDVHLRAIQELYSGLERGFHPDLDGAELASFLDLSFEAMLDIAGRHWLVVQGCLDDWTLKEFKTVYGLDTRETTLLLEQDTWLTRYGDGILRMARAVKADPALFTLFRDHDSPAVIDAHLEARAGGGGPDHGAAAGFLSLREEFLKDFGLYQIAWDDRRILLEEPARVTGEVRRQLERDLDARPAEKEKRARSRGELLAALPARLGTELRLRLERELPFYRKAFLVRDDHAHYIDLSSGGWYRRACLLAGERLKERGAIDEAADVGFLERDEIKRAVAGGLSGASEIVEERKRVFEIQSGLKAPDAIGLAPPPEEKKPVSRAADNAVYRGYSGTRAVVRGEARFKKDIPGLDRRRYVFVFKDVREIDFSDILFSAAGLVFEAGSPFDHVGIWARENGIPALFGAAGAADGLETGDLVELDGEREELRLVRRTCDHSGPEGGHELHEEEEKNREG